MNNAELDHALSAPNPPRDYGTIPTGSVGLDVILGGGWPVQGVSEIYGPPTSGRSTLLYYAIANAQKRGLGPVGLIDRGCQFNQVYAEEIGVDLSEMILARFTELVEPLTDICPVIVIDDLAPDDLPYGLFAPGTTVVYTLQTRKDLSSGRTVTAGHHLAPCTRVELEAKDQAHGNLLTKRKAVQAFVRKGRAAPLDGHAEFEISCVGIDQALEVLLMAVSRGLVDKRSAWYYLGGKTMARSPGVFAATAWLYDNPYTLMYLEDRLRSERS